MHIAEMNQKELLKAFHTCMEESLTCYKNYIAAGKTYRFACLLKEQNNSATLWLKQNGAGLPEYLHTAVKDLLNHYTIWTADWEELAALNNPLPEDEFVFPTRVAFPGEAASMLENYYLSLP